MCLVEDSTLPLHIPSGTMQIHLGSRALPYGNGVSMCHFPCMLRCGRWIFVNTLPNNVRQRIMLSHGEYAQKLILWTYGNSYKNVWSSSKKCEQKLLANLTAPSVEEHLRRKIHIITHSRPGGNSTTVLTPTWLPDIYKPRCSLHYDLGSVWYSFSMQFLQTVFSI